ncbi:enhancer of polycomb-like-domain-containing protein [Suillus subalutaceus]|uniref:enhancer of polycomb-like-domain-containing protein n=1 Tax=Suillus subalutaceus TaxID=48586 RepID=UPI001B874521|nr:enhancer of polycomb-like-domain-containing protein [Suillus subalutaceus]KAG1850825.1 enhancer of polycomb-like-domain-containing protein [Suillus subalutaceus]
MPRNPNLGTSTLRNRNRVTNKTRLKVIQGSIDADPLVVDEDEEKARIISTAGVDAEDANEHHLQAVLSAASQRHQSVGRSTRGEKAVTPAAYIPTPDSTGIVDNYDELYPSQRWEDPGAYIRSSETVDEAVSNALVDAFTYYMDERDKEWLDRNNEEARGEGTSAQGALSASGATTRSGLSQRSAKAKGKEPESTQPLAITEDEFELVMGIFEKVTHDTTEFLHHGLESGMAFPPFTDYQEAFSSPLPSSMFATFTVPTWIPQPALLLRLAKVIYPYWRDRRIERKGHRIIPILNFDESDVLNESYICFRRREIKAVRKTRASQATSSDKLLRLQNELTQGLELAKTLLSRENLKRDYTQQTLQVWDKRFEFAELKRKFPSLGTKEEEELLLDKERVVKKPKIESSRITGLKIRTRESGDPGSPAVAVEASIRPKERLSLINAAMERDLASQKERDHGYEDVVENPYQRPTFSFPRRHWKAIFSSSRPSTPSPNVAYEEPECVRYVRHRVTRLGNATIDRRDAFIQRYGIHSDDSAFTRRRQAFARRMDAIIPEDDEEMSARVRERWKFDQDDEPTVGPEGADEQDRTLIDDYDPKYLRQMMTLLSDQDHQALTTDNTIVVTVDGRQHTVSPYRLGVQPQYSIRRDQHGIQRVYPGGMPLSATRAAPAGIPMPNGVPISMQAHVKAMQPPSAIPQMRISSNGAMRPPVVGKIASPSSPTVVQQSSPPHAASTNGVNGNHTGTPTSDGDSVRLIAAPNGIVADSTTTINGTVHQSTDVQMSPPADPSQSNQAGSPARLESESQHTPVVPLSGYRVPMNGYPMSNGAVVRPPNGFTLQQMPFKMFASNAEGRPVQVPYGPGHLVQNGAHFNVQLPGGANLNIKGRQWAGVASPHQQPAQLNEGTPSPHVTPGNLPTRTPSANGMRTANRAGSINVPPQVGQLLQNQYVMSPHMQHNNPSPLPSSIPLPSHQSPPRPPPPQTMKMASPSLQHQQVVQSSQGGY